jgi:2-amino-4-hydroxy-6-hydroxymethyldihydropteridine diphosphokinase
VTDALVAFGANLGDPARMFAAVAAELARIPGVKQVTPSSLYKTAPVGERSAGSEYVNGCLRIATELSARELFARLQDLERAFGRTGKGDWAPRAVDLDLVLFGNEVIDEPDLAIPHPRMHYRRFVLEPAAEVAAERLHACLGKTLGALNAAVSAIERRVEGGNLAIVSFDESVARKSIERLDGRFGQSLFERQTRTTEEVAETSVVCTFLSPEESEECYVHAGTVVGVKLRAGCPDEFDRYPTIVLWYGKARNRKPRPVLADRVFAAVDLASDPDKQLDYFIASLAKPVKLKGL